MTKNLPVPTADEINKAHEFARESAGMAVEWAVKCGQLLAAKKASLRHGEFQSWIEKNCEFTYSTAARYMKAGQNSTAVEISSIRHLFPSGQPGHKPKPTNTPKEAASVTSPADRPALVSALAPNATKKQREEQELPQKIAEIAPAPEFDFEGYEPEDTDEFKANIENVLMADDKLAAMIEELKQVHRELAAVKSSRDHYMSQAGEAVRLLKARDREIERLKRQLSKAA